MLKIQSVRNSLDAMEEDKIPSIEEIEACLETTDNSFRTALGYAPSPSQAEKDSDD